MSEYTCTKDDCYLKKEEAHGKRDLWKKPVKETYKRDLIMRDERVCQKRPAQKTNAVLFENRRSTRQKRPINVKRDPSTSKETYQGQKRLIKRDLQVQRASLLTWVEKRNMEKTFKRTLRISKETLFWHAESFSFDIQRPLVCIAFVGLFYRSLL